MSFQKVTFGGPSLLLLLALLAALAGCSSGGEPPASSEQPETPARDATDAELVRELRDGGLVVFVRHSATDFGRTDRDKGDLADCSTQRNLTDEGRQQAREIGAALERLDVPVGKVLASPYCRTRQTAELAFGTYTPTEGLLSPEYLPPAEATRVEGFRDTVDSLLSDVPDADADTFLVGHESVLMAVTGDAVAEGGAIVYRPEKEGRYARIGSIAPDGWRALPDP